MTPSRHLLDLAAWVPPLRVGLRAAGLRRDRIVVMFHGVDRVGSTRFNRRFLGREQLRELLRAFKRHWDVVPLAELFTAGRATRRPLLAVTFDDGQRNNLVHALPVLDQERVPATFFVTSLRAIGRDILWFDAVDTLGAFHPGPFVFRGVRFTRGPVGPLVAADRNQDLNSFTMELGHADKYALIEQLREEAGIDLDSEEALADYWKILDEKDIAALASVPGMEIGSHAQSHTNLTQLPEEEVERELVESKRYLERATGRTCESLAFPNGSYSPGIVELAERVGYSRQLVVEYANRRDADDPRLLDRTGLYLDGSLGDLLQTVMRVCPPA